MTSLAAKERERVNAPINARARDPATPHADQPVRRHLTS
jgi:hypothetical protein